MKRTTTSLLLSTLFLGACGGGGEDNPDPGPVASAPAAAAAPAPTPGATPSPSATPSPAAAAPVAGVVTPPPAADAPMAVPGPVASQPPAAQQPPAQQPPPPVQAPPLQPAPVVPVGAVVRTDMTCQDSLDGTGQPWQIAFEIDTTEQPYRNFWSYGNRGSYFQVDPVGDILNKRGIGEVPDPARGLNLQPQYWATVTQEPGGVVSVTIGSMYFPWNCIYTLQNGRMLRALRTATQTVPGTLCFPVA